MSNKETPDPADLKYGCAAPDLAMKSEEEALAWSEALIGDVSHAPR